MAIAHKGAISFGLVYIPINMYTATQDSDIAFNQLHKADNSRIKYKKVCTHCGKEVKHEDIVKGFQYQKDKYVVITDEEIEKIKTEKDKTIQILQFTKLNQISPIYYDKAYYVLPDKGGGKALELLRLAMLRAQTAALGKSVFGNSERLLIIIPREDGVLIQTLLYHEDVKEIPAQPSSPAPLKAELDMAERLIESMSGAFEPEKYADQFQGKLKDLISAKISGKEVGKTKAKAEKPAKVYNLMEALKASVEASNAKTPLPSKSAKPTRKRA